MKFIWNEPPKDPKSEKPFCLPWPKPWWEDVVWGWLRYNGVWPHDNYEHRRIEYNYCYHFFDITLFECWLPFNGDNKREAIDKMYEYLKSSGLDWSDSSSTWIWDYPQGEEGKQPVMRPGVRFWIQAEDFGEEWKVKESKKRSRELYDLYKKSGRLLLE